MEAISFENLNELTVEAFIDNSWKNIAKITFPKNADYTFDTTEIHYESDYVIQNLFVDNHHAVSINHPVMFYLMREDNKVG